VLIFAKDVYGFFFVYRFPVPEKKNIPGTLLIAVHTHTFFSDIYSAAQKKQTTFFYFFLFFSKFYQDRKPTHTHFWHFFQKEKPLTYMEGLLLFVSI